MLDKGFGVALLADLTIIENINVVSIVGRFLEHSRIYHFANDGDDEYFIGSADLMTRNLKSRVEVLMPVTESNWQAELDYILDLQLGDGVSAWEMQPNGGYVKRQPADGKVLRGSQQVLIQAADKRHWDANRLKKRKPRGVVRRKSP